MHNHFGVLSGHDFSRADRNGGRDGALAPEVERVVITRKGKPVALVVGIEGLDREQIELGASDKFWKLIVKRRKQKPLSREALERKINSGK